jgi:hypothetical protein
MPSIRLYRSFLSLVMALGLSLSACDSSSMSAGDMGTSSGAAAPATEATSDAFAGEPFPRFPDRGDIWRQRPDIGEHDHGPDLKRTSSPTLLTPPPGGARSHFTLSSSHAAWIETAEVGAPPQLFIWPLGTDEDPIALHVPNLTHPHHLSLGDHWLFYVDDRYGDDDIFAVNLITGQDHAVATEPGLQGHPDARGSRVLWEDCRACLAGGVTTGREIYTWDAVTNITARLTDDDVEDRAPRWGTTDNGTPVPIWITGERTLQTGGLEATQADVLGVDTFAAVAMSQGMVTARESKGILNPDSMIPSDVWRVDLTTGDGDLISSHVEMAPGLPIDVQARGEHVAWMASDPSEPGVHTLVVATLSDGSNVLSEALVSPGGFALTDTHVGFTARDADGEGPITVWIAPLP